MKFEIYYEQPHVQVIIILKWQYCYLYYYHEEVGYCYICFIFFT